MINIEQPLLLTLQPVSKKARSRFGKEPQRVFVEQRHRDEMFCRFSSGYYCWMPLDGGEHYDILEVPNNG